MSEVMSHSAVLDALTRHSAIVRSELTQMQALMPSSLYSSSRDQMRLRAALDDMNAALCYVEAAVLLAERSEL